MTITFTATGKYERSGLPDSLGVALAEEIQRHMEAYGFTGVTVSRSNVGPGNPLDSTAAPE